MNMNRKWISIVLSLCLIVALLPAMASPTSAANASERFKDLEQNKWYVPYVAYVAEHGLMAGISEDKFAPNLVVTRAQYIQTLYALAQKPAGHKKSGFTDVKNDAYYYNAVNWAADTGVTGGMTKTSFGPNVTITREQAATFFKAYAEKIAKKDTLNNEKADLSRFPDQKNISSYAVASIQWAVGEKLVAGVAQGKTTILSPKGVMTRAQLATMLKAFDTYLSKDVKYLEKPDNPTKADEYYWSNSDVLEVIDATKSPDTLTDKDTVALLKNRGFEDYSVISEYSMNGDYIDETEIGKDSTEKHPMYETYYISESGVFWTIFVINGKVFANPVSYNLDYNKSTVQLLFSESDQLTSYDDESNRYYITKPYSTAIDLKSIDKINAESLDKLTIEEIEKYEK